MNRRGMSLLELLAVMTATTVVTGVATGLLHRAMSLQSASRRTLERERAIFAMARQFRADARTAIAVERSDGEGDEIVALPQPGDRRVWWRRTDEGLARLESDSDGRRRREDYRIAASGESPSWRLALNDGLVILESLPRSRQTVGSLGMPAGESGSPRGPDTRVEIVARLNDSSEPRETEP